MKLKELKKTWELISPVKELNEKQLHSILSSHSKSLIEKIDRNIKIGFALLTLFIAWTLFDYLYLTPHLRNCFEYIYIPKWMYLLDGLTNALIVATFIYFVIRYSRIKGKCVVICNMKDNLIKIITTLSIYKKLFYLILLIFIIDMSLATATGFYQGFSMEIEHHGLSFSNLSIKTWVFIGIIGLMLLGVFCLLPFLILRWGFNELYGNYIKKLKETLLELEETMD